MSDWRTDPNRIEYRGFVIVTVNTDHFAVFNPKTGNRLSTTADVAQARRSVDAFLSVSGVSS